MTGQPLKWEVVSGAQARTEGHPTADLETEWLKVHLARPVPKGGEGRVLIDKTYKDRQELFPRRRHDRVRSSLGIRRNAVVLPRRLSPDQLQRAVAGDVDGRRPRDDHVHESRAPAAAPLVIRAKPGLAPFTPKCPTARGRAVDDDAGVAGVAPVGSRAPGSRDRLFPERSDDAFVQPVSRLHGVAAGRGALLQRRPRRQPRVESVGGAARHRRGAEGRDDQRRRVKKRGLDPGEPVQPTRRRSSSSRFRR